MIYEAKMLPDTRWVCLVKNDNGTRYIKDGNMVEIYSETKQSAVTKAQQYVSN